MTVASRRPLKLAWPTGGLQWKPEWQALLPALRGVRTPTPPDLDALLAEAPLRGEAAAKDELTRARLAVEAREAAGLESWLQLYTEGGVQLAWLTTVCAGLRGLARIWARIDAMRPWSGAISALMNRRSGRR